MTAIAPWQVWWADLDPVRGHEQGRRRPVLIVSSRFHLQLNRESLLSVLPMTTRERPGFLHRITVDLPGKPTSYLLTDQVRTITADRLDGRAPIWTLKPDQADEVRQILRRMLDL